MQGVVDKKASRVDIEELDSIFAIIDAMEVSEYS
jgi:hypothetical protein